MSCRVIRKNEEHKNIGNIQVKYNDKLALVVADDISRISYGNNAGLSCMYEINTTESVVDFTSNTKVFGNNLVPNTGLLSNTVIPVLADSKAIEADAMANTVLLYGTEGINEDGSLIIEPITAANGIQLRAKKPIQEL